MPLNIKKPELLAPAGSMDALKAAIAGGADAVYLGGKFFGARSFASNFTNEELKDAVILAHTYQVRIYVTVNTLIYENEVPSFLEYVDYLVTIGIDALIIQDIGMMDLIRKTYPNLELHASTQMHIHNLEGVKLLESLGLKRCVLARETSLEDIKKIKENTNMELEIFAHGALCISYSGQCLMSSLNGGRSGNRGSCTQCCRLPYDLISDTTVVNENKYVLSTKDLSTLSNLEKLLELSIDSLKIEGRMKRCEYVYQVTHIYRKAIDTFFETGKAIISKEDIDTLKVIFNREYTKGFIFDEKENLTNEYRPNHQGIQIGRVVDYKNGLVSILLTKALRLGDGIRILNDDEDCGFNVTKMYQNKRPLKFANIGDIVEIPVEKRILKDAKVIKTTDVLVLQKIDEAIKNNERKISIDGKFIAHIGAPLTLKIINDSNVIIKKSDYLCEEAINAVTENERIEKQLSKLGGTPYYFDNLVLDVDNNVFIKIDEINKLRREAILDLTKLQLNTKEKVKKEYTIKLPNFNKEQNMNVLVSNKDDYLFSKKYDFDFTYTDNEDLYYDIKDTILKLPRVMTNFKTYDRNLLVGELGSVYKYDSIETDFSLNVTNSYSVAFLHALGVNKITLSYELTKEQINDIVTNYKNRYQVHPNLEVIIYSRPEVMISKYNLLEKYNLKKGVLKDKVKNKYPVVSKNGFMYIYLYKPIIKDDYLDYYKMGINNLRVNILNADDYKEINHLFS